MLQTNVVTLNKKEVVVLTDSAFISRASSPRLSLAGTHMGSVRGKAVTSDDLITLSPDVHSKEKTDHRGNDSHLDRTDRTASTEAVETTLSRDHANSAHTENTVVVNSEGMDSEDDSAALEDTRK